MVSLSAAMAETPFSDGKHDIMFDADINSQVEGKNFMVRKSDKKQIVAMLFLRRHGKNIVQNWKKRL